MVLVKEITMTAITLNADKNPDVSAGNLDVDDVVCLDFHDDDTEVSVTLPMETAQTLFDKLARVLDRA